MTPLSNATYDFAARLQRLQNQLEAAHLDAFLVSYLKNIRYLTGFTGTTGYLVVMPSGASLFVDPRYTQQALVQASAVTVQETVRDVIKDVLNELNRMGVQRCGFEARRMNCLEFSRSQATLSDTEWMPTTDWIEALRACKDDDEVRAIRSAVEIADAAYHDFLEWFEPGMTEREVAARLEFFQRNQGGDRKASETVVSSGPRTALPHGIASEREIQAGEPVMIDIGAVVDGYTSDLTRTVHLGTPPDEFEAIYRIVLDALLQAEEHIRPGMTGREVDALARDYIVTNGYGAYFGHSLGHSVGLEIHEKPGFSTVEDTVIEPGMVLTVEPGIYLPGKFGVRIEDMILITDDGCEVLTGSDYQLQVL